MFRKQGGTPSGDVEVWETGYFRRKWTLKGRVGSDHEPAAPADTVASVNHRRRALSGTAASCVRRASGEGEAGAAPDPSNLRRGGL